MEDKEKATPVTPDEIEDIRVTLELDEGEVECKILTIFDVNEQDYTEQRQGAGIYKSVSD